MLRALSISLVLCGVLSAADPNLFFREDWADTEPALPVTQEHVANPELVLALHGPGKSVIKKSFHKWVPNDPHYIWSGVTSARWAVSLSKPSAQVDLTKGRVRWRAKQAGFMRLRIIVETADGQWFVSEASDGPASAWHVTEFILADTKWRVLDIETVIEKAWGVPDLSGVKSVGFTDLSIGGASSSSSRLDWIEVYGKPVK
ncbi:MAG: hypothetical protein O3A53_04650 [Acidobacteria bacterium]|nr:hypothetical protein [Acidobacteriota bacterium]MDA1234070.1 hypothetical protein [Acidobacteriota bacterium]